jgi:AraC family transcriptional activator of pobA
VHHIKAASMDRGWYFACEPAFITEQLRDILDQFLSEVILVSLSPAQATRLAKLLDHLYAVQHDHALLFRQDILQQLATAFVYQLAAAYVAVEQSSLSRYLARSVEITKSFKQLLRQQYKVVRKPAEFAARLHITTTHLNDTVRAVTGFPVTYYNQQKVMQEAQRSLARSSLSINEVAYSLGFDDAKYFIRLFGKVICMSPGTYRKAGGPTATQ